MNNSPVQDERIKLLNSRPVAQGKFVLYWMQQSQRAEFNHALEFAVWQANQLRLPLLVVFGLMDNYPEANLRHYRFMLEGLRETQRTLLKRGIKLVVEKGNPADVALRFAKPAALVVVDRGYLRHQKQWREQVATHVGCTVIQVESDVVVPVETASDKAEFAARTIRPKIQAQLRRFLVPLETVTVRHRFAVTGESSGLDLSDVDAVLAELKISRGVPTVSHLFRGGSSEALGQLSEFLEQRFNGYRANRQAPETNQVSHLGKYLHFGQISPVQVALAAEREKRCSAEDKRSFLEELIVRRELAQNFVNFTPDYDRFSSLPLWARRTLTNHEKDIRPHLYNFSELEAAETHDDYWNAAMLEMKHTGYLHNAMRMYWGKKILEWSVSPEQAFTTATILNNKYLLDGRDPNSYANIGWIFGLHDRPWPERPIFGKVRFMNATGLERKSDIAAYVKKVALLNQP